jgi:hypothetical protein
MQFGNPWWVFDEHLLWNVARLLPPHSKSNVIYFKLIENPLRRMYLWDYRTLLPTGYRPSFLFGTCRVQISVRGPTEGVSGFPYSLPRNSGMLSQMRPQLLPFWFILHSNCIIQRHVVWIQAAGWCISNAIGSAWLLCRMGLSYHDWNFRGFPDFLQENLGVVSRVEHDRFLTNHFQLMTGLYSHNSALYSPATDSAVK